MSRNRKPKLMKWDVFVARRGIDIATWLTHNSISNVVELEAWCLANNIEMPSKSIFVKTVRVAPPKPKVDEMVTTSTMIVPSVRKPRENKVVKQVELHVEHQEAEVTTTAITTPDPAGSTVQTD